MSDLATMQAVAKLIPMGSRVLDLGCGDGALLAYLQSTRNCTGYGIEIDDANLGQTRRNWLNSQSSLPNKRLKTMTIPQVTFHQTVLSPKPSKPEPLLAADEVYS